MFRFSVSEIWNESDLNINDLVYAKETASNKKMRWAISVWFLIPVIVTAIDITLMTVLDWRENHFLVCFWVFKACIDIQIRVRTCVLLRDEYAKPLCSKPKPENCVVRKGVWKILSFSRTAFKKIFFFIVPVLSNNNYNKTSYTKQKEKCPKLIEGLKNNCKIFQTKTSMSFYGARSRRARLEISRENYMLELSFMPFFSNSIFSISFMLLSQHPLSHWNS